MDQLRQIAWDERIDDLFTGFFRCRQLMKEVRVHLLLQEHAALFDHFDVRLFRRHRKFWRRHAWRHGRWFDRGGSTHTLRTGNGKIDVAPVVATMLPSAVTSQSLIESEKAPT